MNPAIKMKAILSIIVLSLVSIFSSCKKINEEPVTLVNPDARVTLYESSSAYSIDSLFVKRSSTTAILQVSAQSNASDMKRIYVFKKSVTLLDTGRYETYENASLKKDGNGNYYYAVPTDQKNNTVLNLVVKVGLTPVKPVVDTIVADDYFFAISGDSDYKNPPNTNGILVGPAHIHIVYGLLTQTTGHKIFNPKSKKSNAFDLTLITNRKETDTAVVKDMSTIITTDSLWKKSFTAGTSQTLFVKVPPGFNDTHVTDLELKKIYQQALDPLSIQSNVSSGDLFIAQLRGKQNYALVKITAISDENLVSGQGKDSEYMQFSVFK